jgi:hypothetical protein
MTTPAHEWREEVNRFIEKWCKPEYVGHLLDTDENDGQKLRDLLTTHTAHLVERIEKKKYPSHKELDMEKYGRIAECRAFDSMFNYGFDVGRAQAIDIIKDNK